MDRLWRCFLRSRLPKFRRRRRRLLWLNLRPPHRPPPQAPSASWGSPPVRRELRTHSWQRQHSKRPPKRSGTAIKVETQGSVGAKNQLTAEDIAAADAVVIAAETNVDTSRFGGKRLYMTSTKQAMHAGQDVLRKALEQPVGGGDGGGLAGAVEKAKADRAKARTGPYKHLMTGVSYMLPLVVAGGLAIALAFAIGGIQEGHIRKAQSQLRSCRSAARRRFVCLLRYFQGSLPTPSQIGRASHLAWWAAFWRRPSARALLAEYSPVSSPAILQNSSLTRSACLGPSRGSNRC